MNLIHSSRIPLGFPTLQPLPALVNGTMLPPDVKQMIQNQTYTVIDEPRHKSCLYVSREYAGRTEYYIIAPAEPDTKMAPGMALADLCCVTVSPLEALILGSGYGCAAYTYLGRIYFSRTLRLHKNTNFTALSNAKFDLDVLAVM